MKKPEPLRIGRRAVGPGHPAFIVAEMSANHNHRFGEALRILAAAKKAGADAVKIQTYTPDTITIDSDKPDFRIGRGTLWEGKTLYKLYGEAHTPWEWQEKLKKAAEDLGMQLFSSPFDHTAVDFLEKIKMPAYKIASFELVDIPLIRRVAKTKRPMIFSTGMATEAEIKEAVGAARSSGARQILLLKCTSAYPAPEDEMNLRTIPDMAARFGLPVGLSDHTMGIAAPVAAVALGACMIEKHFTLSRGVPGPDSAFSLEPKEFKAMVDAVRATERALGTVQYGAQRHEAAGRIFRRSLFIVADMKAGELFTADNVRSIRPGNGLHTRHLEEILGRRAARDLERGMPLSWELIEGRGRKRKSA